MALQGSTNEEKIYIYFKSKGLNDFGSAGLMGNLRAESRLIPTNLQNSFETKLKLSDSEYTKKVDDGTYTNFVRDSAGYGLAQWTYWSRKQNLLNFARSQNKSIGDLEMQLDFLYKELSEGYKSVLTVLKSATSVLQASNVVLLQFEKPANQGESVQKQRAQYGQEYYEKFANKQQAQGGTNMSNSPLVLYTKISPNKTSPRNHAIDTITIHCIVGQWTAKQGCDYFAATGRKCSANYVVGKDGEIGLSVEEKDRSWCSSSSSNDNRAITIECASDTTHPYKVNDKVYASLIKLITDICKRNNIKKLLWKADKSLIGQVDKQNMTVHRWFANKSCPGDYLYNLHGKIAEEVNKNLGIPTTTTSQTTNPTINSLSGTVKVIYKGSDGLNIRTAPSMLAKVSQVVYDGTYTVVGISSDGEWYKLKSGLYITSNEKYVKFIKSTVTSINFYNVKVTEPALNIRSGAGTQYKVVGCIRDKGIYSIIETSGNWGKLKSGAGWICLDYTKRI